ncbi:MAG: protein-glutamate O-methyltransferase CheR, partial [Anaerolineae bacterium]
KDLDIIFCRNTFIYFDREVIARIVDWFYRILNPGGYLFLGAAESLLKIPHRFELDTQHGAIGYRKPSGG